MRVWGSILFSCFLLGISTGAQTVRSERINVARPDLSRSNVYVRVPTVAKTNGELKTFEQRSPKTFVVNSVADRYDVNLADGICTDAGGRCSLRAAIDQANAIGSGVITFDFDVPTRINIVGDPLSLHATQADIELRGPGADRLTIGRDPRSRVGGSVFIVASPEGRVSITGITVSDGSPTTASPGSCILVSEGSGLSLDSVVIEKCSADAGGGIASWGDLQVVNSTIRHNSARLGGGVFTAGSMTMRSSVVYSNKGQQGGGINNNDDFHTATIINSTITGNNASGGLNIGAYGGGIFNFGPMDMTNVTIAENSSADAGAGFADFASVWAPELSQIKNTLMAKNSSPGLPDLYSYGLISHGYNLVAGGRLLYPAPTDLQGTESQPIDVFLGPLADNGGPTLTMALLPGSPAIDRGGPTTAASSDQRGFARVVDFSSVPNTGDGSDIGAFEVQIASARLTVRALGPWGDPIRVGTAVLVDEISGEQRLAVATTFGYFRFNNVPTGRNYRIVIKHKRYTFAPLLLSVDGDLYDLEMIGTL